MEVRTADEIVVHLERPRDWPRPELECDVKLSEVHSWVDVSPPTLAAQVKKRTGWTVSKVEKQLRDVVDETVLRKILGEYDEALDVLQQIAPALRRDDRELPIITLAGRRYLAKSASKSINGNPLHSTATGGADRGRRARTSGLSTGSP